MTTGMSPIVRPRECGGTSVITVVMSSGIMMAIPLACTIRPARSTSKPGATDDDGHCQRERRGQPLGGTGGDVQILHHARIRDADDRLVQDHNEGRDQHEIDDQAVALAVVDSCLGPIGARRKGAVGHRSAVARVGRAWRRSGPSENEPSAS